MEVTWENKASLKLQHKILAMNRGTHKTRQGGYGAFGGGYRQTWTGVR